MGTKNVSADTLFHYTTSLENIVSILKNGFQPRYCLESYDSLLEGPNELAFPMVCFCDIAISQVSDHVRQYGKYAVGLKKQWGMQKEVTPLIYTYPNAVTAKFMSLVRDNLYLYYKIDRTNKGLKQYESSNELMKQFVLSISSMNEKDEEKKKVMNAFQEMNLSFGHFLRHIKPYEGRLYRRGSGYIESVKFYNEREWRYVPNTTEIWKAGLKDSYVPEVFKRDGFTKYVSADLSRLPALTFSPEDVKFIIVRSESEISKLIDQLDTEFQKKYSAYALKLMYSKLISLDQINSDF